MDWLRIGVCRQGFHRGKLSIVGFDRAGHVDAGLQVAERQLRSCRIGNDAKCTEAGSDRQIETYDPESVGLNAHDRARKWNCVTHNCNIHSFGKYSRRGRQGTEAPRAAGVIHTNFERGFIRAETIAYDDHVTLGGEAGRPRCPWAAPGRQGIRGRRRRRDAFQICDVRRDGSISPTNPPATKCPCRRNERRVQHAFIRAAAQCAVKSE
jgi:hypothetical protein